MRKPAASGGKSAFKKPAAAVQVKHMRKPAASGGSQKKPAARRKVFKKPAVLPEPPPQMKKVARWTRKFLIELGFKKD